MSREQRTRLVLHIDDEEADRIFFALAVRRTGLPVTVHGVTRIQEALAFIESRGKPDLIVLDVVMPGFDRTGPLQVLRERCPTTPLVLLTGFMLEEFAREALGAGAEFVYTKPFDSQQLEEIAAAICHRAMRLEPAEPHPHS